jgi:hypothetical protein
MKELPILPEAVLREALPQSKETVPKLHQQAEEAEEAEALPTF